MSYFIFINHNNYSNDFLDDDGNVNENKKKILISNIFKDTCRLIRHFLLGLDKLYFEFNDKIKDLDKIFNFDEEDLKILRCNYDYVVNLEKKNKTDYKKYLIVIMKFIDNWENFTSKLTKIIMKNPKKYDKIYSEVFDDFDSFFEELREMQDYKLIKKINKSYESQSRYYINHIIYCVIFSKFEYMACDNTIDYMKSFLTNINLLFKFNVLPNTNKKLKKLLSYFGDKINRKYEYLNDCKKMLIIIYDFYSNYDVKFDMSNLDYLNDFEDTIFIFYEFLNLCFVLLEDNIDF